MLWTDKNGEKSLLKIHKQYKSHTQIFLPNYIHVLNHVYFYFRHATKKWKNSKGNPHPLVEQIFDKNTLVFCYKSFFHVYKLDLKSKSNIGIL